MSAAKPTEVTRRIPKAIKDYALLRCFEWLRDELRFGGTLTPRQEQSFKELLETCVWALGRPTVADVERIKEDAQKYLP